MITVISIVLFMTTVISIVQLFFQVLSGGVKVSESSVEALKEELTSVQQLFSSLDNTRARIAELHSRSLELLEQYGTADQGHNLSHLTSRINMAWTKLNDKSVFG